MSVRVTDAKPAKEYDMHFNNKQKDCLGKRQPFM